MFKLFSKFAGLHQSWTDMYGRRFSQFIKLYAASICVGVTLSESPSKILFLTSFEFKLSPTTPVTTSLSKDVDFSCASFDICEKFVASCPPTQTPTQKLKIRFSRFSSQEIGSSFVSLELMLYNLSFSDSSFRYLVQKSWKSRNSA